MSVRTLWARIRCSRWEEALSLRASGLTGAGDDEALENHLAGCVRCRSRLAELERVASELRGWAVPDPAARPSPALRNRWESAVRATATRETTGALPGGRAGESAIRGPREAATDRRRSGWGWLGEGRWVWGTVAACWLVIGLLRVAGPGMTGPAEPETARGTAVSLREVLVVLGRGAETKVPAPGGKEGGRPGAGAPALPRSERPLERRAA